MSCNHLFDCQRCGNIVEGLEKETERLRALIRKMKAECVQTYSWGRPPVDALRAIEHLTACALDPAPDAPEDKRDD